MTEDRTDDTEADDPTAGAEEASTGPADQQGQADEVAVTPDDDIADSSDAADGGGADRGEDDSADGGDSGADDAEAASATGGASDDADAAESSGGQSDDAEADTAAPARPVVRRKVVSKRVTPKGGGPARSTGPATRASRAAAQEKAKKKGLSTEEPVDLEDEPSFAERHRAAAQLPSPWWVPALMFGLIIVGALVIILNYMGAFGDPSNVRLIIGLVFILGGIITATQYR